MGWVSVHIFILAVGRWEAENIRLSPCMGWFDCHEIPVKQNLKRGRAKEGNVRNFRGKRMRWLDARIERGKKKISRKFRFNLDNDPAPRFDTLKTCFLPLELWSEERWRWRAGIGKVEKLPLLDTLPTIICFFFPRHCRGFYARDD